MSGSLKQDPPGSNESSSSPVEDPQGLANSPSPVLHHGTTSAHGPVGTAPLMDPSAWSIMKDAVEEMRKLREALHTISEKPCNCVVGNISQSVPNDTSRAEKSTDSWKYIPDYELTRSFGDLKNPPWLSEKTRSRLGNPGDANPDKVRESLLHLLHESRHPYIRIRKHPMQSSASEAGSSSASRPAETQVYDMVTGSSYDNCMPADQACEWVQKENNKAFRMRLGYHCIKHIPKSVYDNQHADSAGCFGTMLWIVDTGPMNSLSIGTLDFATVALLSSAFFGLGKSAFAQFLVTFANMSHPIATRSMVDSLYSPEPQDEYTGGVTMVLQHHLRHFKPVLLVENQATSVRFLDLVIERQVKKIPLITQVAPQSEKQGPNEQNLVLQERALSASLLVFPCGTFGHVVLADEGVYVESPLLLAADMMLWDRIGIYPWDSGKGAGVSHFLVALCLLMEAWHRSWNEALDAIDAGINFEASIEMPYTPGLGQKRLEDLKFDASSSMFYKQYYTVLAFLRFVTQSIDEDMAAWKKTKSLIIKHRELLHWDIVESGDRRQSLEDQLGIVTELWNSQTKQLKERIDRTTEDVKSMRDGLFSATSLRVAEISLEETKIALQEAKKGTALNRAIYVFTVVTIIYTPLGFMATFWALPILNTTPEGENIHPSRSAIAATFVIIPVLTYVACGWAAWYFKNQTWVDFADNITMKQSLATLWTRLAQARREADLEAEGGEVAGSHG